MQHPPFQCGGINNKNERCGKFGKNPGFFCGYHKDPATHPAPEEEFQPRSNPTYDPMITDNVHTLRIILETFASEVDAADHDRETLYMTRKEYEDEYERILTENIGDIGMQMNRLAFAIIRE